MTQQAPAMAFNVFSEKMLVATREGSTWQITCFSETVTTRLSQSVHTYKDDKVFLIYHFELWRHAI